MHPIKSVGFLLVIFILAFGLQSCSGGGGKSCSGGDGKSSTGTNDNGGEVSNNTIIRGYVLDDPVPDAEVYIDFGDGSISTKAITNSDGSFELELSDEDLAKINPEVPEGEDAPIDDLLIVAKKGDKVLRNAITRDINNIGDVYITNDSEAYAEFLESTGSFSTNALASFNSELQNGRIKDSSKYATLIKDLREKVRNYFYGGEKPTNEEIFEMALQDLDKAELAKIADDRNLLPVRNIVSGGDIILPPDVNVSSDDITITPKGNGRYTLGDGNDPDRTVYLKIAKSDGTFALIPVNIKSKTVTEIASESVTPTQGATLGSDNDVKVTIPPFALNETKDITIKKIETEGESADGKKILDLEPNGIHFKVPITIKIHYSDFGIDDPYAVQWKYGSLDEGYEDANIVSVDTTNKIIYLSVDHFSDLLVKKINGQEFLDLGPNFVTVIPARNFEAKLNGDYGAKNEGIYNLKNQNVGALIITNRIFKGDSFNHKRTKTSRPGGGHCVQTVYILQDLIGKKINTGTAIYNINKWKSLSNPGNEWITDLSQASTGDVVYQYGGDYGHTSFLLKEKNKYYLLDSNGFLNNSNLYGGKLYKYYPNIGEGNWGLRIRLKAREITNEDLMRRAGNKYQFNSKSKGYGYFTRDEIIELINKYIDDHNEWINAITNNGKPLTERIDLNKIQKTEDDYNRIISVLISKPNIVGKYLVKHLQSDDKLYYPQYKIVDQNDDIYKYPYSYYFLYENNIDVNHPNGIIQSGNSFIYYPDLLPVAPLRVHFDENGTGRIQNYEDARYEIYAEYKDGATFRTSDNVNLNYSDTTMTLPQEFGNNIQLTRLAIANDDNKTSLVMVANYLDRSITVSGINSPIKILFSPIVIDDYYVNWGSDNLNHNIPIGFWNSRGYGLDYAGEYNSTTQLEADKIYKSEDAVNGYFMTLGNGESAEWHFTLAGTHAILVNVPTGKYEDIKNARFTLYLNNQTIPLVVAGSVKDTGMRYENSAFDYWFFLKRQDNGEITFDLTGNDYLKVEADNGTIVVDAIRLEGRKNRLEELKVKGKADLSNEEDEAFYKCLLNICVVGTNKCLKTTISLGKRFVLPVPANLNREVHLKFTYIPIGINVDSIKYKPFIQYITVEPGESEINLPAVTLQEFRVKSRVRLHVINALDGSPIKDADVTVRYGIDNNDDQSFSYTGVTDENGYVEITDIPYGQYTVALSKDGFAPTSLNIKVDENSDDTYDLSMSPVLPQGEMRIVLSWGANPEDLDSHLVKYVDGNQEYHIYYMNKSGTNGDNLDRDDTDGYGPETVTIKEVDPNATYVYFVHKYAGDGEIKDSGASVKILYGSEEKTFYPPQEDGEYWKVFTIKNGTIIQCVSNCMGTTDNSILQTQSIDESLEKEKEKELFRNLPSK